MPAMSDAKTTVADLRKLVKDFSDERDWSQFQDTKNFVEALSIEVGELMEHFLWKDKKEIAKLLKSDKAFREEVGDELADVLGYTLHVAESCGIDLSDALRSKFIKNAKKYPVARSKGRKNKYTKL
jgi:dCTP diphosphatase